MLALACGSMVGLLAGGTWAEWEAPNDVSISVCAAFASHLKSFWWEVLMLAAAATVGGFCCDRFIRRRSQI